MADIIFWKPNDFRGTLFSRAFGVVDYEFHIEIPFFKIAESICWTWNFRNYDFRTTLYSGVFGVADYEFQIADIKFRNLSSFIKILCLEIGNWDWKWNWKLKMKVDNWNWKSILKINWNRKLKLTIEIKNWDWKLKSRIEIENKIKNKIWIKKHNEMCIPYKGSFIASTIIIDTLP